MTISDRIFERLQQLSISQKEFAGKAGIQQSTISEWKKTLVTGTVKEMLQYYENITHDFRYDSLTLTP